MPAASVGAGKCGTGGAAGAVPAAVPAAPWRVGGPGVPGLRPCRVPEGASRAARVPGRRCVWRSRVAGAVWPRFGRANRVLGLTLCHWGGERSWCQGSGRNWGKSLEGVRVVVVFLSLPPATSFTGAQTSGLCVLFELSVSFKVHPVRRQWHCSQEGSGGVGSHLENKCCK